MKNFVAIDFETAQPARYTACSIGIIVVIDGVIVQRFQTLIQPLDNIYSEHNTRVHGIEPGHTENAPTFKELYPILKGFLNGAHVVCHNASFDIDVLMKTMEYNGISYRDLNFQVSDTLDYYGKSLNDCCSECGIELNHHDSLSDAEACARLFLRKNNIELRTTNPGRGRLNPSQYTDHQRITGQILKPELDSVEDKTNPFYGKKVVITGTFNTWPDRTLLAKKLQELGADIDTSVTTKTHILVAGNDVGPKKMEKMLFNINTDESRKIINENEVNKMLGYQ
ncbi:MAG: hypothetical protein FD166_1463 [Bacteroidetes bacterium]|nr:MAG: hypothetical protein FD166_1463 [Bacteroidota bacterium]